MGKDGQLQALDGAPLLGKNGRPITVDPAAGKITVLADGTVQQGDNTAGQIDLKAFATPGALQRIGANRYDASGSKEASVGNSTVNQGALEESGVDLPTCMIDMIKLNRLFEMSMKVASTVTNDMDERSITDISSGH
jgi:flagellar basal body rod protein FlgG